MTTLSCDFETTTKVEDCRVWAVGIYNVYTKSFEYGNSIDWLFEKAEFYGNCRMYFHNLKFDGAFILDWLFRNGFNYTESRKLTNKEFSTLISDKNQFYSIKIRLNKHCAVTILDSLKIIPFNVKKISKAFGLNMKKGEIDYHLERPIGHIITDEEMDYIKNDCSIVGEALKTLFNQNLDRMTQGSNALKDFKNSLTKKFEKIFPPLSEELDNKIRPAYKGGYSYVNKLFKEKDLGKGIVFDKNSMYPWAMKHKPMPYGTPKEFEGKYEDDPLYPLYTQKISCMFDIKPDHLPTIQIKSGYSGFMPTEYLETSGEEEVILTLTSVDLKLFLKHYETYGNIKYLGGYKFKSAIGIFDNYIDKWYGVKEEASKTNNAGMRTLAKLMLNALYGKFATTQRVKSKIPYYDDDYKKVCYKTGEEEKREGVYLPVACFITAYAREDLITIAQSNYFRFAYSDTDSLHFIGRHKPNGLEIDKYKLGAWGVDAVFNRAKFIRSKCYIEDIKEDLPKTSKNYRPYLRLRKLGIKLERRNILKVTCAGMPYACHPYVTWENFKIGSVYLGKKQHKVVSGGAVLKDTTYRIKID